MWEYYCNGCHRLLLRAEAEKPQRCSMCAGTSLEVDSPGSERLKQLRFGDREPDAPFTAILIGYPRK